MSQADLTKMASELGKRRQAQKRAAEAVGREQAFEDFVALGVRRSKAALLARYQAIRDEEGPQAVPTLSRDKIDTWAREDNWIERALKRDRETIQKAQANAEELRLDAAKQLPGFLSPALKVIEQILDGSDQTATAATRLRAAELVLQINGMKNDLDEDQTEDLTPFQGLVGEELDPDELYRRLLSDRS